MASTGTWRCWSRSAMDKCKRAFGWSEREDKANTCDTWRSASGCASIALSSFSVCWGLETNVIDRLPWKRLSSSGHLAESPDRRNPQTLAANVLIGSSWDWRIWSSSAQMTPRDTGINERKAVMTWSSPWVRKKGLYLIETSKSEETKANKKQQRGLYYIYLNQIERILIHKTCEILTCALINNQRHTNVIFKALKQIA